MDTQIEGIQTTLDFADWDKAIMILEEVFPGMPKPRRDKCETLFHLAREAEGLIVELGAYLGNGTVALCLGSRVNKKSTVVTIDQYIERRGWANEEYNPDDRKQFWTNVRYANVTPTLIIDDINAIARGWKAEVSLLFWDPGCENVAMNSFIAWNKHIKKGGVYAIHDTATQRLGSKDVIAYAEDNGFVYEGVKPGGVYILRKLS